MSDKLGTIVFDSGHDEVFIGRSMGQMRSYSEEIAGLIDEEIKAIIDGAYARCREILTAQRDKLDLVADYLLEHETMDAATFEKVFTDPQALRSPAESEATEPEKQD
jgi:cell division protease FtsH